MFMVKTAKKSVRRKTKKGASRVARVNGKKAFRTYDEAMKYLYARTDYEKEKRVRYNKTTFNLSRMENLLKMLGSPHKKINTVHIAGTKGKGSTATMLAKMLESNNYRVGLYTSPHVLDLHERIVVDSKKVGKSQMLRLMNRIYKPVEKLSKADPPSFFEIMTALAFMHFVDENVDIAVIETGLGGKLDSTNVIKPHVVGITSLSIDHQEQLGQSLSLIAAEKAGVFKRGVPIITVEQEPSAMKVLKSEALRMKAPLMVTGRDIDFSHRFEISREDGPHTRICLTTPNSKFEHLRVPLHGTHQAINCGLALAMLDKLKDSGYVIDNEKAKKGLKEVSLAGRMEMICDNPRIMIDAAHNADSIRALMHAIGQNVPYDSMVVIFGCNVDKDIDGMLKELQYGADKVIFTRSNSAKAAWPEDLGERYNEISGKMFQTALTLREALRLAQSATGREDLICITGSFYLIGQAKLMYSTHK
jgi:dihydrofolate synthase/folylpolyglutamate synthase